MLQVEDNTARELAVTMLKKHEGYRRHPYRDSVGVLTVAHGRNLDAEGIDPVEAEFLLNRDVGRAIAAGRDYPFWFSLGPERQAVVIDMIVNLGAYKFAEFLNTLHLLDCADYSGAATEMLASAWAHQVGRRAVELAQIMRSGVFV
jgi:lysozyme